MSQQEPELELPRPADSLRQMLTGRQHPEPVTPNDDPPAKPLCTAANCLCNVAKVTVIAYLGFIAVFLLSGLLWGLVDHLSPKPSKTGYAAPLHRPIVVGMSPGFLGRPVQNTIAGRPVVLGIGGRIGRIVDREAPVEIVLGGSWADEVRRWQLR